MSFSDRFAAQVRAFNKSQSARAWSFVTGLIAAFYALGITVLASSAAFSTPYFDALIAILWAGGAIAGAASLIFLGLRSDPTARQLRIAVLGLWVGNLVACGNIFVLPIVFPLSLAPVLGGFIFLKQYSVLRGAVFLSLPFIVITVQIMNWALGFPLGAP